MIQHYSGKKVCDPLKNLNFVCTCVCASFIVPLFFSPRVLLLSAQCHSSPLRSHSRTHTHTGTGSRTMMMMMMMMMMMTMMTVTHHRLLDHTVLGTSGTRPVARELVGAVGAAAAVVAVAAVAVAAPHLHQHQ